MRQIMLEPTNICNLRCPVCLTGGGYDKRPKANMTLNRFKKVVKPVEGLLETASLWGFGEPFLAPDIMKMINYLGNRDKFINIHTNGNTLTKKTLDQFKSNYKIHLTFSIDGITQKSYVHYRRGGSLKKALDNLSYLINLKNKHNLFNIVTTWQFLVTGVNEHEIEKAKEIAKKRGVDQLRFKTISVGRNHSLYQSLTPLKKKHQRKRNRVVAKEDCVFLFPGIPNILVNGDVVPCCHDYSHDYKMGNAFKESLIDIWNNQKYKKFRKDYKKGINQLCNEKCKFTKKSKIYLEEIRFN